MDFEKIPGVKEVSGSRDIEYTCDICGTQEYSYSEEFEELSYHRIFRIESEEKDYCEYCLIDYLKENGFLPKEY